jgi:hypothetical protein
LRDSDEWCRNVRRRGCDSLEVKTLDGGHATIRSARLE